MPQTARRQRSQYPDHDYADEHTLTKAREQVSSRRRLRDAATLRASGEVACERIREFAWDLGAELRDTGSGWMAAVAREIGINERTGWWIFAGHATSVSTRTVDAIARATGIPIAVFYDPET